MNRRATVILAAVFGGFFLLFLVFLGIAFAAVKGQGSHKLKTLASNGPKIGVVELKGVIGEEKSGIAGNKEAEQIRDFAQDDEIKAIVIRINSPGGAVAPSQEIAEEIIRSRTKKKVICSQGNVAASGGYYISVACDKIVADAGTLTGSIGVISQFVNAKELIALAHLQETTLKTGALKDSGSPFREFNEQDQAYMNGLLHEIFEQFVKAVADGRHLKIDDVRTLADGRVFTGLKAKELGLVDEIGNFRTAVDITMQAAHLEGEPDLIYPEKKSEFPFLDALKDGATATGASMARGAIEGMTSRLGLDNGILLLAPGFAPYVE
jgi:protease-4